MKSNEMNIVQRVKAPTPKFFKVLRTIGLALATVGGTIIASPIALPAGLVAAAGYLVLGGGVLSAVSQTAVQDDEEPREPEEDELANMSVHQRRKYLKTIKLNINIMGVGTTCLGAKELNRSFIGIEKEVKYYDLAVGRVFGQHCH